MNIVIPTANAAYKTTNIKNTPDTKTDAMEFITLPFDSGRINKKEFHFLFITLNKSFIERILLPRQSITFPDLRTGS